MSKMFFLNPSPIPWGPMGPHGAPWVPIGGPRGPTGAHGGPRRPQGVPSAAPRRPHGRPTAAPRRFHGGPSAAPRRPLGGPGPLAPGAKSSFSHPSSKTYSLKPFSGLGCTKTKLRYSLCNFKHFEDVGGILIYLMVLFDKHLWFA